MIECSIEKWANLVILSKFKNNEMRIRLDYGRNGTIIKSEAKTDTPHVGRVLLKKSPCDFQHVIKNVKCCGVESYARLTITLPKLYVANFICPELSFN